MDSWRSRLIDGRDALIRAGTLCALAVTSATRTQALPNVPTGSEFVPGYEASTWFGISAPRDTPAGIIDKRNHEINAGLRDPKTKGRLADQGGTVVPGSPADFAKLIVEETNQARAVLLVNVKFLDGFQKAILQSLTFT